MAAPEAASAAEEQATAKRQPEGSMPAKPRTAGVSQPAPMTALRSAISVTTGSLGPRRTPGAAGVFTLQLVLDQGAWEEVLTVSTEDAEVLRGLLAHGSDAA